MELYKLAIEYKSLLNTKCLKWNVYVIFTEHKNSMKIRVLNMNVYIDELDMLNANLTMTIKCV